MATLEIRPNCEACNQDLAAADEAYICTYECTFCRACKEEVLKGICPNCLGDLQRRPTRTEANLKKNPASTQRVLKA